MGLDKHVVVATDGRGGYFRVGKLGRGMVGRGLAKREGRGSS